MKRPWQIWTLFFLSLAIVLPALVWLSVKALELDRAEAAARRQTEEARRLEADARAQAEFARQQADLARAQAELQELASSALWRMDWTLTPIVAQEAARPYYVYLPFYPVPNGKEGKNVPQLTPSPLLIQPSEFVLLNFQISPDDVLSSPQNPLGVQCDAAVSAGTPRDNITASAELCAQLGKTVCHEQLVALLPEQMLPRVEVNPELWVANTANFFGGRGGQEGGAVTYDLGLTQLNQQLAEQQGARSQAGGQAGLAPNQNEKPVDSVYQGRAVSRGGGRNPDHSAGNTVGTRGGGRFNEPIANGAPGNTSSSGRGGESGLAQATPQFNFGFNNNDIDYEANRRDQMLRGGNEWQRRNRAYETYAQTQLIQQRQGQGPAKPPLAVVSEGISRPIWVGKNLLLARRVEIGERVLVQGCWLDWPKLKEMLLDEISDLMTGVELEPVLPHSTVAPGRTLATLPVQLVMIEPEALLEPPPLAMDAEMPAEPALSPIRLSLLVAWACFLLATFAVGILLQGVITLSERRGAFVSAVTHELRTPLTTFRMYAEMLAAGMVPSAEQRQKYLDTLRVEADRLAHLVENVLSYARLERGKAGGRRESISLGSLLDRTTERLADRSRQAGMKLSIEGDDTLRETSVSTDPAAVEQILFNLVDNACKYAGSAEDKRIHLSYRTAGRHAKIEVTDHGPGISALAARRLFRPFSKSVHEAANSAPGVGLGLALSRRLARALGGSLDIAHGESGAKFVLSLPLA